MIPVSEQSYAERIAARRARLSSVLVVGIDPDLRRIPAAAHGATDLETLGNFCHGVLEEVVEEAVAIKPQIALFERHGWRGWPEAAGTP